MTLEYASPDAPQESRFAYMSPQVEEILGFTPEETMADPLFFANTLHPGDVDRVMAESMRVQGTGEPFDEFRQRTKDGRYRWIHDRAVLVRDDDGSRSSGTASPPTSPPGRRPSRASASSRSGTGRSSSRSPP